MFKNKFSLIVICGDNCIGAESAIGENNFVQVELYPYQRNLNSWLNLKTEKARFRFTFSHNIMKEIDYSKMRMYIDVAHNNNVVLTMTKYIGSKWKQLQTRKPNDESTMLAAFLALSLNIVDSPIFNVDMPKFDTIC